MWDVRSLNIKSFSQILKIQEGNSIVLYKSGRNWKKIHFRQFFPAKNRSGWFQFVTPERVWRCRDLLIYLRGSKKRKRIKRLNLAGNCVAPATQPDRTLQSYYNSPPVTGHLQKLTLAVINNIHYEILEFSRARASFLFIIFFLRTAWCLSDGFWLLKEVASVWLGKRSERTSKWMLVWLRIN